MGICLVHYKLTVLCFVETVLLFVVYPRTATLYFQNVFLTVNIPVYWNHVTATVFASVVLPLPVRAAIGLVSCCLQLFTAFPVKDLCGASVQAKEVQ